MRRKRLTGQLYPPFLFILLVALLAVTVYDAWSLRSLYRQQTVAHLGDLARAVSREAARLQAETSVPDLDALAKDMGRQTSARITVIGPDGTVLGDSSANPREMDNHGDRPEVQAALIGGTGRNTRFSFTTRQEMVYVAVPVLRDGAVTGVVRTSLPSNASVEVLRPLYLRLFLGVFLIAAAAAAMSLLASHRIARQAERIRQAAESYANGDTAARVPVSDGQEFAEVAEALNRVGTQFEERMQAVLRQRNELEAVLASMEEAVVAVDSDRRIIGLNAAAGRLFHVDPVEAAGHSLETIRNTDLHRFVERTISGRSPVEGEIAVYHGGERTLQAHGTVLREGRGQAIGAVVVLNDITRLRRLETARRDFVANVSHELRTPITSIQGYSETLLDGGLEDTANARRFVETIHRQADRLNALITDLLMLARIEQDAESHELDRQPTRLRTIMQGAVEACESQAAEKGIHVRLVCDDAFEARINPTLLEQAVVNLLDNAIQYSHPEGTVEMEVVPGQDGISIAVRDHGCGIFPEHLPRLFERFYRVDAARSRQRGGTGLGLAIVKHIVRLHGGRTDVQSTPGKGSTFSIHLPRE